jgi:hypothetical protein
MIFDWKIMMPVCWQVWFIDDYRDYGACLAADRDYGGL